jgi:hypothetical protein
MHGGFNTRRHVVTGGTIPYYGRNVKDDLASREDLWKPRQPVVMLTTKIITHPTSRRYALVIEFNCPKCRLNTLVDDALAGQAIWCQECKKRVTVPRSSSPVEAIFKAPGLEPTSSSPAATSKVGEGLARLLEPQMVRTALRYWWVTGGVIGFIVLVAAAWNNREFSWLAAKALAFTGILLCIAARYWRIAIIAGDEPIHWLGLILPMYVAVYQHREELNGPDRLSLFGVISLIVAVVLACISA